MSLLQHIMERIRPVVGLKGWSYCVFWKFSEDQRFLELMDCCCAGTESNIQISNNSCGEDVELLFPVSSAITCRDVMFQHPRTKSCDLLSQLPSSIPLDSGIHAQTLMSDQPRWLINFSNSCHSHLLEEPVETRVLIPISVGLIELFVDKQVSEDQRMIDFITSQFSISNEQQTMTTNSSFSLKAADSSSIINENDEKELFQPPVSPATMLQNLNLRDDISEDQIPLHNSSMNFLRQFNHEGFDQEDVDTFQKSMLINSTSTNANINLEPLASKKRQNEDRDSMNRSDSLSDCSDQNDDEDNINDAKCRKRNGNKGPQSKNLVAERNRRKKLNERLYNLRSLVPKITKLDRASILGDAIEYVMELQQQVSDLQNELERNIDLEDEGGANDNHSSLQPEILLGNEPQSQHGKLHNGTPPMGASSGIGKKCQDSESTNDKLQQMEPQVEVIQLDGNEFFVKVFCEHKPGGFVKLMEALNSLGLEVTNVNVTSLLSLVLNVFKVERKDSEMIEAEHVRESLLDLTRNPPRGWPEMSKAASEQINGNGSSMDSYHQYHHHHQNTLHLHSHQLISQPNHHIHHLP